MSLARRILPEAPSRRGWCPSLARPMLTGDGLLARIHPPLGILTVEQARAVAEGARRFGNGHVDVTARANLQIRGVSEATREALATLLHGAGLGDVRHDGGPQRLTLTAPLAGSDVVALARAIEAAGLAIPGLPAKTLVAVEAVERSVETDADIRLVLVHEDTAPFPGREERDRGPAWEAAQRHDFEPLSRPVVAPGPGSPCADAAGVRERAAGVTAANGFCLAFAGPDGPDWFVTDTPVEAVHAALRILAASGARRMRDLPPGELAGLIGTLGLTVCDRPAEAPALGTGLANGRTTLVLGAPFGRCTADALDRLAESAETLESDLHLSPSRGFVLVATEIEAARRAADALSGLGFITRSDDPRSAVAACPGAPACASGSTATLADAERLAELFRPFAALGLRAHVSGCAKGCAHPAAADLTLVGHDGLYGVVLGGPPSALPAMRLPFEAALERLRRADPSQALAHAFRTTP